MPLQKIMVPVDGSAPSNHALDFAVSLASALNATVEIVTVLDLGQLDFFDGMYRTTDQIELWQEKVKAEILNGALARVPEDGPEVITTLLRGAAVKALLSHIRAASPDMVVMGRTGRSAVDRILHGSVSRRVSGASPVPVTLVG